MANVWQKRKMKLKGFAHFVMSYGLLRHSKWNRARLQEDISRRGIERLHIGCGDVLLNGWLNIKFEPREAYGSIEGEPPLLNYNLLKQWPVAGNTVQFVAGSHVIEHLDLNHGIRLLQEAYRVMKPGGTIRLSCPDLELYAKHYVNRNQDFYNHKLIREWCAFSQAETPGEIFAAKAYDSGGAHKWFYDFDSLKHILEKAGFQDVRRCGRLEGKTPDLGQLELPARELETVYVEASK